MKLKNITTKKIKKLLKIQKQAAPNSEAVRAFEKELLCREIEQNKRFLSLKALATRLELPEKYLFELTKAGIIPFINIKGKVTYDWVGVVDSLARLNIKDRNIDRVIFLYEKLKGIHRDTPKSKK